MFMISIDGFTEAAFLDVCRRRGKTPSEMLEADMRAQIAAYLVKVQYLENPAAATRLIWPSIMSWPYTDADKPESFEAAIGGAKELARLNAE